MLSYRHSYHAGNFADVLKHIVMIEILEHLIKKDKPFDYIDTHAGAGLYDLRSEQANKVGEYKDGIDKINFADFPELAAYKNIIDTCNEGVTLNLYPGSPAIAQHYLREFDRAWLFEMHPTDYKILDQLMQNDRRVRVARSDGFKGLLAKVPPLSKRALVMIDPSYEIKEDYNQVFDDVTWAYKKFATGIYAIWYPVIERRTIQQLEAKFIASGIKNIQLFELGLSPDSPGKGMTSSGMIVLNPPWTLMDKMARLLPRLLRSMTRGEKGNFRCVQLVEE